MTSHGLPSVAACRRFSMISALLRTLFRRDQYLLFHLWFLVPSLTRRLIVFAYRNPECCIELGSEWVSQLHAVPRSAQRQQLVEVLVLVQALFETFDERLRPKRAAAYFLLAIAVRLLPQSERARYLEEFRAELLDLPRNTRLSHALSLLRGVFVLRLRRGLRNKAADAAARKAKE